MFSETDIILLHTLTYTSKLTMRDAKNETLRQKRLFQISKCELPIYL